MFLRIRVEGFLVFGGGEWVCVCFFLWGVMFLFEMLLDFYFNYF